MYFKIVIDRAKIPDNYSNIYVEYDIKLTHDKKETYKTKTVYLDLFRLKKKSIILYLTIPKHIRLNVSLKK